MIIRISITDNKTAAEVNNNIFRHINRTDDSGINEKSLKYLILESNITLLIDAAIPR